MNRSLRANSADEQWFVGTHSQAEFFESLGRGVNTLLTGPSGAGKTTTLRMLELRLRRDSRPVCFVSFALADELAHAVVALYHAAAYEGWVETDDGAEEAVLRHIDPYASNELIRRLVAAPREAVFLVDDVDATIGHDFFGRLRDELWQLDLTWGAAARNDAVGGLLRPPADAFFERRIELVPFTLAEREQLLQRRLAGVDDAGLKALLGESMKAGGVYPRDLIARARNVAEGRHSGDEIARAWELRLRQAEQAAGRAGAMVVSELEHLGPVSASDPELLDRLGWTRPRAVVVLGRLEEANVVRSFSERRDTPGRPRKIYELRPVEDFVPNSP